jgi:RimJ/RimL family protein N-acetyltransferase
VLATQTANAGSMRLAAKLGFTEVERFRAWDADQWLGRRAPRPDRAHVRQDPPPQAEAG